MRFVTVMSFLLLLLYINTDAIPTDHYVAVLLFWILAFINEGFGRVISILKKEKI